MKRHGTSTHGFGHTLPKLVANGDAVEPAYFELGEDDVEVRIAGPLGERRVQASGRVDARAKVARESCMGAPGGGDLGMGCGWADTLRSLKLRPCPSSC